MDELNQQYIDDIKAFQKINGVDKLATVRDQGLKNFERLGLPARKNEDWMYTAIKNFLPASLNFTAQNDDHKTKSELAAINERLPQNGHTLVFNNGVFDEANSNLPKGLEFKVIDQEFHAINQSKQLPPTDCFEALNLATLQSAYYFNLRPKIVLKQPVTIVHLQTASSLTAPCIWFEAAPESEACIIELFAGKNNASTSTNTSLTTLIVSSQSKLEHIKVQLQDQNHVHVSKVKALVSRDASFNSFTFSLGGKLSRHNLDIHLLEENAFCGAHGLYALKESQHCDYFSVIKHHAPHTSSEQLFKGLLNDQSRGVFTGRVVIDKDAQNCTANQLNKNLLLSQKSHAHTRPQLEVHADDVKCAHGATIGQMDREELFYLESRGISHADALKMLMLGFASDVLAKIKDNNTREWLESLLYQDYEAEILDKIILQEKTSHDK